MAKAVFNRFEFLSLHIVKTSKMPLINMVFPVQKKIQFLKPTVLSISGGRTTWKIQTNRVWNDSYIHDPVLPEISTLILTPTKFAQWPNPRVPPLIEKVGEGEAVITFFGYENWDTYFGDSSKQM